MHVFKSKCAKINDYNGFGNNKLFKSCPKYVCNQYNVNV